MKLIGPEPSDCWSTTDKRRRISGNQYSDDHWRAAVFSRHGLDGHCFGQSLGTGRHAQRGQYFPNSRTRRVELQKLVAFVATSTHTGSVVFIRLSGEQHDRT